MDKPQVTISIPTFNRSNYLRRAIDSVLAQTFTDFELIVIDAASKDDTSEVVANYTDRRIRYLRLEKDPGSVECQNLGIELAKGEFISILHDDDMLTPLFLERSLARITMNPKAGMVFSSVTFIDEDENAIGTEQFAKKDISLKAPLLFRKLLRDCPIIRTPSVMIRKSCYDDIGYFETGIRCIIDWDMWLRISLKYDVEYISMPLALYRWHAESDSLNRNLTELIAEDEFVSNKVGNLITDASPVIQNKFKKGEKLCRSFCELRTARKYYSLCQGKETRLYLIRAVKSWPLILLKKASIILVVYLSSFLGKSIMQKLSNVKNGLVRILNLKGIQWNR
ncbi:glycosyltransferase [Chloroflexota bacterium]